MASYFGHAEVVSLLLEANAAVDAQDSVRYSLIACICMCHINITLPNGVTMFTLGWGICPCFCQLIWQSTNSEIALEGKSFS